MDVPFVDARIIIPLGSAHNVSPIRPGSFHFLEHMVLNRSKMNPELDSFSKIIGLNGGHRGGSTYPFKTVYSVEVKHDLFDNAFRGLMSQVFEPIFTKEDIDNEVGVIKNERRRRERFFPGNNKLSKYLLTEWMNDPLCSMTQRLGSDTDLEAMDISDMLKVHEYYFNDQIYVFVGGKFEVDSVCRDLSKIETKRIILPEDCPKISWKKREYHEGKFDDVNRYTYYFGGLNESINDPRETNAVTFILSLLVNHVQGSLYNWLRNEKGWVYEIDYSCHLEKNGSHWKMFFPVNNEEQVKNIRDELHNRIIDTIKNSDLVEKEINRLKSKGVFFYQTLGGILNEGIDLYADFGKIFSELELISILESFADTDYLMKIYEKHMSPGVTGEFLAIPE
jgi:predicted Zn-dependent peptidase